MAERLVAKLLRAHLAGGSLALGQELQLRVDQVLLEDYTGTMACLQFEALKVDRISVPFAFQYVDHNVLQLDLMDKEVHSYLNIIVGGYWHVLSHTGNGTV